MRPVTLTILTLVLSGCAGTDLFHRGTFHLTLKDAPLTFTPSGRPRIYGRDVSLPRAQEDERYGVVLVDTSPLPPPWRPPGGAAGGVTVAAVDIASPLAKAGLRDSDLIESVGGVPVTSVAQVAGLLRTEERVELSARDGKSGAPKQIAVEAVDGVQAANVYGLPPLGVVGGSQNATLFQLGLDGALVGVRVASIPARFHRPAKEVDDFLHNAAPLAASYPDVYVDRLEWSALFGLVSWTSESWGDESRARLRLLWFIYLGDDADDERKEAEATEDEDELPERVELDPVEVPAELRRFVLAAADRVAAGEDPAAPTAPAGRVVRWSPGLWRAAAAVLLALGLGFLLGIRRAPGDAVARGELEARLRALEGERDELARKAGAVAALRGELEQARGELATSRTELVTSRAELARRGASAAELERTLASERSAVARLEAELGGSRSELAAAREALATDREELVATRAELVASRAQLVRAEAGERETRAALERALAAAPRADAGLLVAAVKGVERWQAGRGWVPVAAGETLAAGVVLRGQGTRSRFESAGRAQRLGRGLYQVGAEGLAPLPAASDDAPAALVSGPSEPPLPRGGAGLATFR